ncbi:MAG: tryptophan--tRNA ligase [Candidatus Aegiribacteria sp.]|nr:tryptophan--tRNA ligase [Candidatus Aegiribacteria sp.]
MNAEGKERKRTLLTGDRPTGPLHIGHYIGSLKNRAALQTEYDTFIVVADIQTLSTNFDHPEHLPKDVRQVTLDNLSVGLDPEIVNIFVQSMVPQIAELTVIFSMFVTVNRLRHNPTIKTEARQYGFEENMTYGFLGYPVSQAADILFCRADIVPVGEDQMPVVEVSRFTARRFNELYGNVFPEPDGLKSETARLVGLDGRAKMSKSLGNCVYLSDSTQEVRKKLMSAVTDPARIHKDDPGHPEICTIFTYHRAFNREELPDIEERCRKGTIGCVACKQRLCQVIEETLEPIRERRIQFEKPGRVEEILKKGNEAACIEGSRTMQLVRYAMHTNYLD